MQLLNRTVSRKPEAQAEGRPALPLAAMAYAVDLEGLEGAPPSRLQLAAIGAFAATAGIFLSRQIAERVSASEVPGQALSRAALSHEIGTAALNNRAVIVAGRWVLHGVTDEQLEGLPVKVLFLDELPVPLPAEALRGAQAGAIAAELRQLAEVATARREEAERRQVRKTA